MWQVDKVAKILKDYAKKTSYDNFRNRKRASAICSDLLLGFDERNIFVMLFREGLGDCLQDAPYTTKYEVSLAKNRVRNFLKDHGISEETINNVTYTIGVFVDVSIDFAQISILEIWNKQKEKYVDYENNRRQCMDVESEADLEKLDSLETKVLSIKHSYRDSKTPSLKRFTNLNKFSNFYPLTWNQVAEIDMQNMRELYFVNAETDSDIVLEAPMLEKLTIFNKTKFDKLTPLERLMLDSHPCLQVCAKQLKYLKLSDFSGYDLSIIKKLQNLEILILDKTAITELDWLKECKSLKELHIYSQISDICVIPPMEALQKLYLDYTGIENIDKIALFPNLKFLSLRRNKIKKITKVDNLCHIKRIDLSGNPIVENNSANRLNIQGLMLTDTDREVYNFDKKMESLFYKAYLMYLKMEENSGALTWMKRTRMNKSDSEKYETAVNIIFRNSFYEYNPTVLFLNYETEMKVKYLEFVKEKYPFIHIGDEFVNQIQVEKAGILQFHQEKFGNVIYINRSVYSIRVEAEAGGNGIEIRFINSMSLNQNKKIIEQIVKKNCSFINFMHTKIIINVFDLYYTSSMEGVEIGIIAALNSFNKREAIPANSFIAGELNKKGMLKKQKISSKIVFLAVKQGAKKIFFFSNENPEQIETQNIQIEYCNQFEALW